jgi:predicted CxxxxCH...CXXCH cytochrome family protein
VGPNQVIINPALHIDGTLQVVAVHPPGWAQPGQHGNAFNQSGPTSCNAAGCHGPALTGGGSGIACTDCHASWQTDCTFCHGGTDNLTGAPPLSLLDEVSRSIPAIGAHTTHVEASGTHGAYDCTACHLKPSSALSPAHVDGSGGAELLFSSINSAATYSGASCSNLYCHGNGRQNNGSASWTSTTALACSGCHPAQGTTGEGMSGEHKKHIDGENMRCSECHQSVVDTGFDIINPLLHVNGVKDIEITVGGTWTPSNKSCSNVGAGCHEDDTERW